MTHTSHVEMRAGEGWDDVTDVFLNWCLNEKKITHGGCHEGDAAFFSDGRKYAAIAFPDHSSHLVVHLREWALSQGRVVQYAVAPLGTAYRGASSRPTQSPVIEGRGKSKSRAAVKIATQLLQLGAVGLEEIRTHDFNSEARDDGAIVKLCAQFSSEFDRVKTLLTKKFGSPTRVGEDDDDMIPLNGVFRFAVWLVGNKHLFAAAAHEDRTAPILLVLGTTEE